MDVRSFLESDDWASRLHVETIVALILLIDIMDGPYRAPMYYLSTSKQERSDRSIGLKCPSNSEDELIIQILMIFLFFSRCTADDDDAFASARPRRWASLFDM